VIRVTAAFALRPILPKNTDIQTTKKHSKQLPDTLP
jgi:hypothetical protein